MSPRGARAARGAAVAAFATLAASVAHTVGGGTPPGVIAIALALAFSTPLAMVLSGERMPVLRASVGAIVAQAALHLFYALGTAGGGTAASVGGHAAHGAPSLATRADASPSILFLDHGHAVAMPVAHVAAAALTVIALALLGRAARAVATAFDTAVRGLRLLAEVVAGLPVAASVRHRIPAVRGSAPALALVLLSSQRHRGPPASSVAA
ncbi:MULTISPECIES: hypothetical protein [unclassified Agromyces]|uniref:hypothetical protein n=1 Tax=unclassified Agromyces TaxID=2639701 RepID=UPI0030144092